MNTEAQRLMVADYLEKYPWLILVLIWVIVWKGLALWHSAQKGQKIWFIILLVVNTLGILEIIYLIMIYLPKKQPPINPLAPKNFTPPSNPNLP